MEKGFSSIVENRFIWLFIVFLCAIFFSSVFKFDYIQTSLFLLFLSACLAVYSFRIVEGISLRRNILFIVVAVAVFAGGVFRYGIKDFHIIDERLLHQIGQKSVFEAVIVEEPISKGSYREYVVQTVLYEKERVLIRADLYPEFFYGDKVLFQGTLKRPEVFEAEGGRIFDYPDYLSREDIFLILPFARGQSISSGNGHFLKTALISFKNTFIEKFENSIPEPESSLLAGILLGKEDSLGKDWEDKFRRAGVSHIVVLSGYNITLVAESVLKAFSFLPLRFALLGSSLGIILFAIAVGGGASVLRASCMALFVLLARATGRTYLASRGLLIAGLMMVLINPKILVFDFGFQLSFLATAALIWVAPIIEPYLQWCPEKWNMREILSATLATQVVVLPLLLYTTGLVSLISILANMLILPIIPVTMFLGFITGTLGLLSSLVAFPFGAISQFFLFYILKIVEIFSEMQFLTFSLESFSGIFLILAYVCLGYLFWKLKMKQEAFTTKKSTS